MDLERLLAIDGSHAMRQKLSCAQFAHMQLSMQACNLAPDARFCITVNC